MQNIGCDYHPGFQQIAFVDTETGKCGERRLEHTHEAEQFYRDLQERRVQVRIEMEASGHSRWFERLLGELNFELWIGDPAQIRSKCVSSGWDCKTDGRLMDSAGNTKTSGRRRKTEVRSNSHGGHAAFFLRN